MPDLEGLRELGDQLRQPGFEELLETRRRRTRSKRIATVLSAAAAGAVVVAIALAPGQQARTDLPPVDRSPTPTTRPTPDVRAPAGQQTIAPDLSPADAHGWGVLASVTNTGEHRGDSELTAVVPDTRELVSTYCRGPADLFYFLDIGDGGGEYGRCAPDADTSLAPDQDIGDLVTEDPVGSPQTIRMWIARPSTDLMGCLQAGTGECTLSDVPPITDPDVDFGFRVYEHQSTLAFRLLDDAGNGEPYPLQALSTAGGAAWLVDRAVVAAPDADRLVIDLPASDGDRLIDIYQGLGRHLERCRSQHADELPDWLTTDHLVYERAFDEICGVDLRLMVDGSVVSPAGNPLARGHFQELGAELSPGTDHVVVVEVVRGDPRDVAYAVVVRTRTGPG